MGCFVYCVFGSCKDITIGPTAIMALMTSVHAQYGPEYAVLLTLLSGIIILFCGLLQLGFLIDFISVPVIAVILAPDWLMQLKLASDCLTQ